MLKGKLTEIEKKLKKTLEDQDNDKYSENIQTSPTTTSNHQANIVEVPNEIDSGSDTEEEDSGGTTGGYNRRSKKSIKRKVGGNNDQQRRKLMHLLHKCKKMRREIQKLHAGYSKTHMNRRNIKKSRKLNKSRNLNNRKIIRIRRNSVKRARR